MPLLHPFFALSLRLVRTLFAGDWYIGSRFRKGARDVKPTNRPLILPVSPAAGRRYTETSLAAALQHWLTGERQGYASFDELFTFLRSKSMQTAIEEQR